MILPQAWLVRPFCTQSTASTFLAVPTALPTAQHAQHARYVATFVSIIAPSIVGGAWAIGNYTQKRAAAAGRAGVEVVEEESAIVQSFARVSSMSQLSEDSLRPGAIGAGLDRVAEVENSLLQDQAVNTGILTTEELAHPRPGPLPGDNHINDAPPTGGPSPVETHANIQPPQYEDPLSVQSADSLPPMGEYETKVVGGGLERYPVRVVPDAFKDLSFDAKIIYASKYGENVWSRTLIYSNDYGAAVGPDNRPLYETEGLKLDSVGNVVSYLGIPVEDLETSGFSKSGSWEEQRAKLNEIRKAIYRTPRNSKADMVAQERIKSQHDRCEKNQARIRKMEEGREKLQKLREDKQRAQAKETTEKCKAKEEADQEERFRNLREDRQRAQANDAAEKKAKEESDRERERLQTLRKDRQQAQDAAEKKGKSQADLEKEDAVRKIKQEAQRKAKEEADKKAKEKSDQRAKKKAGRKAKKEADLKTEEESHRKAKEEADTKASEEADQKAKDKAQKEVKEEADRKAKEEVDKKAKEESDRRAQEKADRKANEEADRQARKKAIEKARKKQVGKPKRRLTERP